MRRAFRASILVVTLMAAFRYFGPPRIRRIDPPAASPGQTVRIEGRNFGKERRDSHVLVDGIRPTASAYVSWSDGVVEVRVPALADSGLLRVVTGLGSSNPHLLVDPSDMPRRVSERASGIATARIDSISPPSGRTGDRLTLRGRGFGIARGRSEVLFSRSPAESARGTVDPGADDGTAFPGPHYFDPPEVAVSDEDGGYEYWSDDEIVVRIPDGAATGQLRVRTQAGTGEPVSFVVEEGAGTKRFTEPGRYTIVGRVEVWGVPSGRPEDLFLWVPLPARRAAQPLVRELARHPEPLATGIERAHLFAFPSLPRHARPVVRLAHTVDVYGVRTILEDSRYPQRVTDPPAIRERFTVADSSVPAEDPEIRARARSISGTERNRFRIARRLREWLRESVMWTASRSADDPAAALKRGLADSRSFVLAACALFRAAGIPAVPISGLLVPRVISGGAEGEGRPVPGIPHHWLEFYLPGVGWIPYDPVLDSGARPGGFDGVPPGAGRYFGDLDNRHIVIAWGSGTALPMTAAGRTARLSRPDSLLDFDMETTGLAESYTIAWIPPVVVSER